MWLMDWRCQCCARESQSETEPQQAHRTKTLPEQSSFCSGRGARGSLRVFSLLFIRDGSSTTRSARASSREEMIRQRRPNPVQLFIAQGDRTNKFRQVTLPSNAARWHGCGRPRDNVQVLCPKRKIRRPELSSTGMSYPTTAGVTSLPGKQTDAWANA